MTIYYEHTFDLCATFDTSVEHPENLPDKVLGAILRAAFLRRLENLSDEELGGEACGLVDTVALEN